ncbi:ATP-binding cassette domain-containing protein [Enterococcus sp. DIV0876]|uniref:ABC transporter ATP-binding protein n=1 Tax=Enterococcus sp. DIV0876 TaxID=2774633 RepID=UPI003D2FC41B
MITSKKQEMLHVKHLQKSFKDKKVLVDVNLSVQSGEIFVLLGANGAGKTTLVHILTTISSFDNGTVRINGCDLKKNPAAIRAQISLTGQFSAVDEELTGRENMQMIADLRHIDHKKTTIDSLLTRFDLQEASSRLVKEYSGGMRRRLDIAMSFIGTPTLLFLDEPTTGLDPQNRLATWEMIKELANQGRTIFLTTQYLEEAEFLADKIAILHEGKIILEGTPQQIKSLSQINQMTIHVLDKQELDILVNHLTDYDVTIDETNLSLSFPIKSGFQDAFSLLQQIDQLPVTIIRFNQTSATLEDIFLSVVQGGAQ